MSEVMQRLHDRWQPTEDLKEHQALAQEALAIMEQELVLPEDRRWQHAYSTMATARGQESGVLSIGPFGTVKTTWGNLVLGPDQRISINGTDTEATLFGHKHPMPMVGSPDFVPGKFEVVNPDDPSIYLNELTHMRNQKPVQQLWDSEDLRINGRVVNLQEAAYYMTSNFANGRDVHRLSPSIQSRIAVEVLTGDVDDKTARAIQSAENVSFAEAPLLPSAAVRKVLAELVQVAYPNPEDRNNGGNLVGNFTVDLIQRLNETGLVSPISTADARTGKALKAASRALMFEQKLPEDTAIRPLIVARAAALVMPTVVRLSGTAEENLMDSLQRQAFDLEKAIAIRRIVAREAYGVAYNHMKEADEEEAAGLPASEIEQEVAKRVDRFSYADHTTLKYNIDKAVLRPETVAQTPTKPKRGMNVLRIIRSR